MTNSDKDAKTLKKFYLLDKEKYSVPSEDLFKEFKELLLNHDKTWHQNLKEDDIQVWTKGSEVSSVKILKSLTTWQHTAKYMFEMITNHEFFVKNCAEDLYISMNLVEKIDENNCILHYAYKSPISLLNPRDFLTFRNYYQNGDEYTIIVRSIVHKDCPELSDCVRADIHIAGYHIYPDENGKGSNMVYLTQTDMNGYVPSWVTNWAASNFAKKTKAQVERVSKLFPDYISSEKN
eukprot:gene8389-214_t